MTDSALPHLLCLEDRLLPGEMLAVNMLGTLFIDLIPTVQGVAALVRPTSFQPSACLVMKQLSPTSPNSVLPQTLRTENARPAAASLSPDTSLYSATAELPALGSHILIAHFAASENYRRDGDSTRTTMIAQTGFNDARGINRNRRPDSPFTLGSANGEGLGEPGWVKPWVGDAKAIVQKSVVNEGDQALQLQPTTQPHRSLVEPQSGVFSIEEHVRFDAEARLVAYTEVEATGQSIANHGAIWSAFPDGRFYVVDGMGDGCVICDSEFTGFTWTAGNWYTVGRVIDVANQTWDFYVNGVKYDPPDSLGFRGTPTYLDRAEYLSEGSGSVYLDAIRIRGVSS